MSSFTEGQAEPVNTGYAIVVVVIQVVRWFFQSPSQGCVSKIITAGGSGDAIEWNFTVTSEDESIWPAGLSGDSSTTVKVQFTPPLSGQNVSLSLKEGPISGGHVSHTGQRPLGTFFQNSGATISLGFFETLYASPNVGGMVQIDATAHSITRSAFIDVRVPGLQPLPEGSKHKLVGQTNPCPQGGAPCGHPDNHWGTNEAKNAILSAAADFWDNWGSSQSPQMGMVINDQSLVSGGLFDINGNWNTPHSTHREGRHVDLPWRVWTGGSSFPDCCPRINPNVSSLCEFTDEFCEEAWEKLDGVVREKFSTCAIEFATQPGAHFHCTK